MRGFDVLGARRTIAKPRFSGEAIGDGFDMSSILNMFTGGMGGSMLSSGGSGGKPNDADKKTQEAVRKALEEQKRREQERRDRVLLYTVLGIMGAGALGTGAYFMFRRRK